MERHEDAEKDEDKLINVAYFIDNKGEVLGSYQKKNLWYAIPLFASQLDGRVSTPLLTQANSEAQAPRTPTPNFLNPRTPHRHPNPPRPHRPPHLLGPRLPRSLPRTHSRRRQTNHNPHFLDPKRLLTLRSQPQPPRRSPLPHLDPHFPHF